MAVNTYNMYDCHRSSKTIIVNRMKELELGIEWQMTANFELVAMYTMSSRRYEDFENQNNYQRGNLLRLQAQVNF